MACYGRKLFLGKFIMIPYGWVWDKGGDGKLLMV